MLHRTFTLLLVMSSLIGIHAKAETVRVAHPVFLGPIISIKSGKTVGLMADILRASAAREGIRISFLPMSSQIMKALMDGQADAIAPMLISPRSKASYDFTDVFVVTGGGLFVRAPQRAPSDFATLSGKTVATPSFGPFVRYIHERFPNVKVAVTKSYQDSLNRVLRGDADAAALNIEEGDSTVAASYAGKISVPGKPFLREPLGLAVAKGQHADLLRRLNKGFAAITADGTLRRIEERWRP